MNTLIKELKKAILLINQSIRKRLDYITLLDYNKVPILIYAPTRLLFYRSNACQKEPETVSWIEKYFKSGDIFFDIGANIGAYSLIAAMQSEKNIQVYAFEPSYSSYYFLIKNILLNKCESNIFPFQICLSDMTEIIYFNYSSLESGGAKHTIGNNMIDVLGKYFIPDFRQKMLSFSIDNFIDTFNIPTPNHIKIDVDGTEKNILIGAKDTLKNANVKTIMIEIGDEVEIKKQIIEYLTNIGFSIEFETIHGPNVVYILFVK